MIARSPRSWRPLAPVAAAVLVLVLMGLGAGLLGPDAAGASSAARVAQQEPVEVCGAVVTDTVWSAAVGRYRATCSVRVLEDVVLTVESGVEVRFVEQASLQIDGALRVNGGSPGDVLFTSDKPEQAAGDWPGVVIDRDATATINGLTIRYAGRGSNPGLQVRSAVGVTVDNTLIEDTDAEGIRVDSTGIVIRNTTVQRSSQHGLRTRQGPQIKTLIQLENVTIRDNEGDAVRTDANVEFRQNGITAQDNDTNGVVIQSGTIIEPITWQADELPFIPDGTVIVSEGITITAGSVIKATTVGSITHRGGGFNVRGTESDPVIFTALSDDSACTVDSVSCDTNNDGGATTPDRGSWRNVDLVTSTAPSRVSHASFRYGTGPVLWIRAPNVSVSNCAFSTSRDAAIKVENVSASIVDSEFVGSRNADRRDAAGLLVDTTTSAPISVTLQRSTFSDNDYAVWLRNPNVNLLNQDNTTDYTNGINGYRITGRLVTSQTWRAGDLPFVVNGRLEVAENRIELVLQPGLTVKMDQRATIESYRGIIRSGTADGTPVLITSLADDACSTTVDSGCDTNGDGTARQPSFGDWGSIILRGEGGFIRNTEFRYGGDSSSASLLDIQASENTAIEDSEFLYSSQAGVRVYQVSTTLTRNRMAENRGAGAKLTAGSGSLVATLDTNTFDQNDGCAVDMDANVELVLEGDNEATMNSRNGLCVSGDSRVSRTWKRGSLPYLVTSDVRVVGQSQLTLEPGTIIKLLGQSGIIVSDKSALVADGTEAEPITFTSLLDDTFGGDSNPNDGPSEPNAGDWNGIRFESSASSVIPSSLTHARILYSGRQAQPAITANIGNLTLSNLEIRDGASTGIRAENVAPTITDNVIAGQRGPGIEIQSRTGNLEPTIQRNRITGCTVAMSIDANVEPQLADNEAEDNLLNGIAVEGSMTVSRAWTAGDLPFLIDGRLTISRGGTLRIEAGTLVKALQGSILTVDYGAIEIPTAGSGDGRVTITSIRDDACADGTTDCDTNNDEGATEPAPGDWEGIVIASTARAASFRNFDIAYAGSRNGNILIEKDLVTVADSTLSHALTDGINVNSARVTLERNLFVGNVRNGLNLRNAASATIDGNVFTQNGRSVEHRATGSTVTMNNVTIGNTEDPMLFCAAVNTTQTWTSDLPRDIACTVNVSAATLTLDPGLVLRFSNREGINVSSELHAEGVTFTAIDQTADYGLWRGLRFEATSRGGFVRHSRFLYGGYGAQGTIDSMSQGALDVSFNVFRRIDEIGVSARRQSPMTIIANVFRDLDGTRGGAVRVEDRGTTPTVQFNRIAAAPVGVLSSIDAQPVLRGNSFAGSSNGVTNRDIDVCVDAQQNWWGSATGPTDRSVAPNDACRLRDNQGGQGVAVSDHVNYTDWMRESPPQVPILEGPRCGVTTSAVQEAFGSTSPRAMVYAYDGDAPDPTVPIGNIEADDGGQFRMTLTLPNGPHKLSFQAVKDGRRSPVSGFRTLEVVTDSPVDPMGIKFEYGTAGLKRVQPLRDAAGCATGCGSQTSGRVTLPEGQAVRVYAPVAGGPTAVEFVQPGETAQPMQYDGVTQAYVTSSFVPVQGPFTIRVSGSQAIECTGFIYLGGQGRVFQDIGASGSPPMVPSGDLFDFDFESGPAGWTASQPWAIVDTQSHSPTHSWHDSPAGNYPPNAQLELRAPGPIDLRSVQTPELRFWHTYRFARGDRGQVEFRTTDSGSWRLLRRFDGTIGDWRGEVISLEEYQNERTFYLRFILTSDGNMEDDGWYVDDVSVNPGGALNGRYDPGEPLVEGAQVQLEQLNLDTGDWTPWNATPTGQLNPQTTDSEGRYEFYYLEPGEYQIVVLAGATGGVYRSAARIVWDGSLGIDAPLQPTRPAYLPVVLKRRVLGD